MRVLPLNKSGLSRVVAQGKHNVRFLHTNNEGPKTVRTTAMFTWYYTTSTRARRRHVRILSGIAPAVDSHENETNDLPSNFVARLL